MVRSDTMEAAASGAAVARPSLRLSKHEAAGNDFLVLLDLDGVSPLGPSAARGLCDRRRGVGADGVLVAGRGAGGAALSMVLYNADGSRAEMSGNGIRCLVQAAVLAGVVAPGTVRVATDAGTRTVEFLSGPTPSCASATVDMGQVRLGPPMESPLAGCRARTADVGNPHLVVVGELALETIDLGALAAGAAGRLGAPVNVEVVRPLPGDGALAMRVFERGVGETEACGTGSCAAAAVARSFGLAGDRVVVHNPGGRLEVRLGADGEPAQLGGPVRHVADVVVDLDGAGWTACEEPGAPPGAAAGAPPAGGR
jgi:diaminopimelate epimerase